MTRKDWVAGTLTVFGTAGLLLGGAVLPTAGSAAIYTLAVSTGERIALAETSRPLDVAPALAGRTLVCEHVIRVAGVSIGFSCLSRADTALLQN